MHPWKISNKTKIKISVKYIFGLHCSWLKYIKRQHNLDVTMNAVSEYLASMAVIGPMSRDVIAQLAITDVSEQAFPPNTTKLIKVHGVPCIAARASGTGYYTITQVITHIHNLLNKVLDKLLHKLLEN